ncbi:MAG: hypothetical protein AAEJ52_02240, partial [Myxococcota bacterium]
MKRLLLGLTTISIVLAVGLTAGSAWAGYKMEIDEFKWISLGMGARFEAGATEKDTGNAWEKNFNVDSVRPYISGQVHEYIKFEVNLDFQTGTDLDTYLRLLDGIVKFEFNDQVNIWGGRFLPPTDRANFSGPYFLNTWAFPLVAQKYPQIFDGRDNGVAFWGYDPSGRLKYQAGVFEGNSDAKSPSFDARLTLNLLDKETGYYNASTYFGEKDILALGLVINAQPDGSGRDATGKRRSFVGWNADLLFEKKFGSAGALMIDAAYYGYHNDAFKGAPATDAIPCTDVMGVLTPDPCPVAAMPAVTSPRPDGDSFFVTAGWYLP